MGWDGVGWGVIEGRNINESLRRKDFCDALCLGAWASHWGEKGPGGTDRINTVPFCVLSSPVKTIFSPQRPRVARYKVIAAVGCFLCRLSAPLGVSDMILYFLREQEWM